jgi:hypothetical protein
MPWKIMSIGARDWVYRSRSSRLGISDDEMEKGGVAK